MKPMSRVLAAALVLAALAGLAQATEPAGVAACRSDARTLCGGVQPGGGRVLACLKSSAGQLSPGCQAALPVLERCAAEVRQLCADGGGARDRRACLRENAAKLSPECRGTAGTH